MVIDKHITDRDLSSFDSSRKQIESELFENFLLFDKVTIKVYGENIPLALMLGLFGENNLLEMIEQDAIRFALWTPTVVYGVSEMDGIDPLMYGQLSSKAHSDPEESIELGFKWLKTPMRRVNKRSIKRKLRDIYSSPESNSSEIAVKLTKSAYLSGKLNRYGFDPDKTPFHAIPRLEKERLAKCAEDILEYSYLLSNGMTSFSKSEYYDFFTQTQKKLILAEKTIQNFCTISQLERIPDLQSIYDNIRSPFEKLVRVRKTSTSRRFRQWLAAQSGDNDQEGLSRKYIDAIADSRNFFRTTQGKITKIVAMSSIGLGAGSFLGGIHGSLEGVAIGSMAQPAVGVALDLVDEFLLDGLVKGWTPRLFIDDLRNLQNRK